MLDTKRTSTFLAVMGAAALMLSSPSFAQDANVAAPAAAEANAADANAVAAPAAPADANATADAPTQIKHAGKLTPVQMFIDATGVKVSVEEGRTLQGLSPTVARLFSPSPAHHLDTRSLRVARSQDVHQLHLERRPRARKR